MSEIHRTLLFTDEQVGMRLDKALAEQWSDLSRSKLKQWIEQGQLLLNGEPVAGRYKIRTGDACELNSIHVERGPWQAEDMPLNLVYQDEHIIIIDKPANLVVHPAAGNWSGTLVNGLLHHFPELSALPRAGIVHRLDKDTTGLMVVARQVSAHFALVNALQAREIKRRYLAFVAQRPTAAQFMVEEPIGRHPKNRLKMAVVPGGKPARTWFRLQQQFERAALLEAKLDTGRTHQIRVHLAHLGLPIYGDPLYGQNRDQVQIAFGRQALHAFQLSLLHPHTRQSMRFEAPLPTDFKAMIESYRLAQN